MQYQYYLMHSWLKRGLLTLLAGVLLSGGPVAAQEALPAAFNAGEAGLVIIALKDAPGQFMVILPGGDGAAVRTAVVRRDEALRLVAGEGGPLPVLAGQDAVGGVRHTMADLTPGGSLGTVLAMSPDKKKKRKDGKKHDKNRRDDHHGFKHDDDDDGEEGERSLLEKLRNLEIEGYGSLTFQSFNWDTDSARRSAIDVERFVIEPELKLGNGFELKAEIEFEHGGTGSTMEFDKFEEFGEFEQEIEKGGEIVVEKLLLEKHLKPHLGWRIGHLVVPAGVLSKRHKPHEYFTVRRSEAESEVIPTIWHETGVEVFGSHKQWDFQGQMVSGLDSTGFSSANWIQRGHQGRFETVNADNLAFTGRADYRLKNDRGFVGLFGYIGATGENRPKPDTQVDGTVKLFDLHGVYEHKGFKARGMYLYGTLDQSAAITNANKNLSNFLNVKRTPVASAAEAFFLEAGYDILPHLRPGSKKSHALDTFLRYDYYDTMKVVEASITDNPRWEREVWTMGLNYHAGAGTVFKADYSLRALGNGLDENTFSMGMGFTY